MPARQEAGVRDATKAELARKLRGSSTATRGPHPLPFLSTFRATHLANPHPERYTFALDESKNQNEWVSVNHLGQGQCKD